MSRASGSTITGPSAPAVSTPTIRPSASPTSNFTKNHPDPKLIAPLKTQFDEIMQQPDDPGKEVWWWCDALFMAPPVWSKLAAVTGDQKYNAYMNHEWHITDNLLWDKQEHLFFRDATYFDKREKDGQKIFWSRGNGWVMGGLVRVLEVLPNTDPSYPFYLERLKEMAASIAKLQRPDGLWSPGLLDTPAYPPPGGLRLRLLRLRPRLGDQPPPTRRQNLPPHRRPRLERPHRQHLRRRPPRLHPTRRSRPRSLYHRLQLRLWHRGLPHGRLRSLKPSPKMNRRLSREVRSKTIWTVPAKGNTEVFCCSSVARLTPMSPKSSEGEMVVCGVAPKSIGHVGVIARCKDVRPQTAVVEFVKGRSAHKFLAAILGVDKVKHPRSKIPVESVHHVDVLALFTGHRKEFSLHLPGGDGGCGLDDDDARASVGRLGRGSAAVAVRSGKIAHRRAAHKVVDQFAAKDKVDGFGRDPFVVDRVGPKQRFAFEGLQRGVVRDGENVREHARFIAGGIGPPWCGRWCRVRGGRPRCWARRGG